MESHQFDQLARVVASGTSRRRVLGMFGAGIAALASHLSIRDARAGCVGFGSDCSEAPCCQGLICDGTDTCVFGCAANGETCGAVPTGLEPTIECCSGECIDGVCVEFCGLEGDPCFVDVGESGEGASCCDDGLFCIDGICQSPEPVCSDEGGSCSGGKGPDCCNQGLECIDGTCVVPEPVCALIDESCGQLDGLGQVDCCDDLVCLDGFCAEPEPVCAELGQQCSDLAGADPVCCDGLVCVNGDCEIIEDTCFEPGDTCESDEECCTGICCGGICADIECCVDDENPNDRCDEGTSCFEGICEGVAELCEADSDCATGTCCCDDGSCSEDCCDPAEEEPVTQLPNTGAGSAGSRISSWIGATAIGAAAAAYLGGKRMQANERTTGSESE